MKPLPLWGFITGERASNPTNNRTMVIMMSARILDKVALGGILKGE
jgi:hypothetical protein